MRSIIVGNGVNIQFSGSDYLNHEIIKRALKKVEKNEHPVEVYPSDAADWLMTVHKHFTEVLRGHLDYFAITTDEKNTLREIKKRYNYKTSIYNIGIEDYILLSDLFREK